MVDETVPELVLPDRPRSLPSDILPSLLPIQRVRAEQTLGED